MNYINEQIQETQKYLPNIRPLKEFVHLNLYHKQQHKFFWQAIEDISLKYSILVLPPLKYYQDLYAKGSINGEILQSHIKSQVIATGLSAEELQNDLFKTPSSVHLPEKPIVQ